MNQGDVDPGARTKLAELARQLTVGHITNDQFEDRLPKSAEVALHEILFCGLWPLYDDFHEHRLVAKHKLTAEGRVWVARIVLFLRSGLPYRWPRVTGAGAIPIALLSLVTLGWFGRFWRRRLARAGEEAVWPFFSQAEYEQALAAPVYLSGHHVVQQGAQAAIPPPAGRRLS